MVSFFDDRADGDAFSVCTFPNVERAAKLSDLAMLWVYAYDPSGNLLHEAGSGSETEAPIIEHIYLGNRLVSSITGYGSACFIASVAYGTPLSEDLDVFRAFRDKVLTRMTAGQGVIEWYYKHGPTGAKWLDGHGTAKAAIYYALVVVAVPLKAVMFGHWSILVIIFLCVLGAFVVGRKLGWKRSTSIITSFALAFGSIIVYSFLVEVPMASASYSERTKYYYTLDHIGRPLNLRDENLYLRWYEQHYPFGEIITEDTPTWDIQAGSGSSTISWTPHFRFPGQFDDVDQGPFVQNHYREYMPELGRYNRVDPLVNNNYSNAFSYAYNNSLIYIDKAGLHGTPCPPGDPCPDPDDPYGLCGYPDSFGSSNGVFLTFHCCTKGFGVRYNPAAFGYDVTYMCNSCRAICYKDWGCLDGCKYDFQRSCRTACLNWCNNNFCIGSDRHPLFRRFIDGTFGIGKPDPHP